MLVESHDGPPFSLRAGLDLSTESESPPLAVCTAPLPAHWHGKFAIEGRRALKPSGGLFANRLRPILLNLWVVQEQTRTNPSFPGSTQAYGIASSKRI